MIDPIKESELSVDGVYWSLSLNGEEIPFEKKQYIKSITIDETCKGADTMTVVISDPNMEFIQDDLYLEDVPISVDINFHGSETKAHFYGYVSTVEPTFSASEAPSLELFCLDKTHLMQRVKNTQTWDNVRSIDVVREKCNGYGWKLVYQEDYVYIKEETISQSKQTDIEFLESLANKEREIFVAKLVGDTFFYVKLGLLAEPSMNLLYRYNTAWDNVIDFTPTIDKETRQVDVQYADIVSGTKDIDGFFANQATVALETQGYPVQMDSVAYGSTPYDDSEYRKWLDRVKGDNSNGEEMSGEVLGKLMDMYTVFSRNAKPNIVPVSNPSTLSLNENEESKPVQSKARSMFSTAEQSPSQPVGRARSDNTTYKPDLFGGGKVIYKSPKFNVQGGSNYETTSKQSEEAEREYRDIEYNTLRGEATLKPDMTTIGLKYMSTIEFYGLGKYLSGLYFVEGVKRTLDCSNGYSQSVTLIKTGFGNSMKSDAPPVNTLGTKDVGGEWREGVRVRIRWDVGSADSMVGGSRFTSVMYKGGEYGLSQAERNKIVLSAYRSLRPYYTVKEVDLEEGRVTLKEVPLSHGEPYWFLMSELERV